MPERIQRKRTAGWRMPEGAVYVGRPTEWGNPYTFRPVWLADEYRDLRDPAGLVAAYRALVTDTPAYVARARTVLAGRDLACWCPLDQPCHADVLLEVANG
jgi:hypothetical protein